MSPGLSKKFEYNEPTPLITGGARSGVRRTCGIHLTIPADHTSPVGLLVYTPQGQAPLEPRQLAGESLSNVLAAIVAAYLLAQARLVSFGARVLFVAMLGFISWLAISVSLWNWHKFPATYTLAELAHELIGFAATGLVLAWRIKASASGGQVTRK